MLPLVRLIEKAAALFHTIHTSSNPQMPKWMKCMHAAVESSLVPRLVRLFLVKAVLHVERRHAESEAAEQQQVQSPGVSQVSSHSCRLRQPSMLVCTPARDGTDCMLQSAASELLMSFHVVVQLCLVHRALC